MPSPTLRALLSSLSSHSSDWCTRPEKPGHIPRLEPQNKSLGLLITVRWRVERQNVPGWTSTKTPYGLTSMIFAFLSGRQEIVRRRSACQIPPFPLSIPVMHTNVIGEIFLPTDCSWGRTWGRLIVSINAAIKASAELELLPVDLQCNSRINLHSEMLQSYGLVLNNVHSTQPQ